MFLRIVPVLKRSLPTENGVRCFCIVVREVVNMSALFVNYKFGQQISIHYQVTNICLLVNALIAFEISVHLL